MGNIVTQRFIKCHDKLKEEKRVRSSRQFAISLDYLPQSLSEILKGRRDVTIELLRKAIEKFKINPIFIYTGKGPMFMSDNGEQDLRVLTIVTDRDNDEKIVHVPVPAQAGYAGELANPAFIQELPSYSLPDYKYKIGTHRSFDVSGDSMEPTLFEGDKVICSFVEPVHWESALKNNHVYVLVTKGDVLVKRVHSEMKDERRLLLVSDNAFYKPYHINGDEIKEIWSVQAKLCPFLPAPTFKSSKLHDDIEKLHKVIEEQSKIIEGLNNTIQQLLP